MTPLENFAIIVAAGKGLRMGSNTKKQYLCLDKIPILVRTMMLFDKCELLHEIVLVIPKGDTEYCKNQIIAPFGFTKKVHLVEGGDERQISVFNGLKRVQDRRRPGKETIVLIHDGVRPFAHTDIIKDCIQSAGEHGACIPGVKITDTIKEVSPGLRIKKTVNREFLYKAQTPQAFKLDLILQAFDNAIKTNFSGTDDASIVEHFGHKVVVIKGSKFNIKITTQEDLVFGESLLNQA